MLFIIDEKEIGTASVWNYQELETFNSPTDGIVCFLMKNDDSISRFKNFFVRQDKKNGWVLDNKNKDKKTEKILLHKYFDIIIDGHFVLMYPKTDFFGFFGGFVTENTEKVCDKYPELLESSVEYRLVDDEELILYTVRVFSPQRFDFLKNTDEFLMIGNKTQKLFIDGNVIDCGDSKGKLKIDPMAERLMKLVL